LLFDICDCDTACDTSCLRARLSGILPDAVVAVELGHLVGEAVCLAFEGGADSQLALSWAEGGVPEANRVGDGLLRRASCVSSETSAS
jgi:hypothetical protein